MNDNCIFCKIINGDIKGDIVYQNDSVIILLDKAPSSLGHLLVIPKKHFSNIFELDFSVASEISKAVIKAASVLKKVLHTENINILQNNGAAAGQTVNHLHVHLIPRYDGDSVNIHWEATSPDENEIQKLIGTLKGEF